MYCLYRLGTAAAAASPAILDYVKLTKENAELSDRIKVLQSKQEIAATLSRARKADTKRTQMPGSLSTESSWTSLRA